MKMSMKIILTKNKKSNIMNKQIRAILWINSIHQNLNKFGQRK